MCGEAFVIKQARVHDLMTTRLRTIAPEANLHRAVELLLKYKASGLPVVDGESLVGIITEQDCLRASFRSAYYQSPLGTVAEAMTPSPETLDADEDIMTAIDRFLNRSFRGFPVLRGGKLVGYLSRREALRVVNGEV
jgi:CBS domain-containing protein